MAGPKAPITIRQNANLYIARLDAKVKVEHTLDRNRHAWIQVARGSIRVNGQGLEAGDGAAISNETKIRVESAEPSEVLLFDLA